MTPLRKNDLVTVVSAQTGNHVARLRVCREESDAFFAAAKSYFLAYLLPPWFEGVTWIRGRYTDDSSEARALLAAFALTDVDVPTISASDACL